MDEKKIRLYRFLLEMNRITPERLIELLAAGRITPEEYQIIMG